MTMGRGQRRLSKQQRHVLCWLARRMRRLEGPLIALIERVVDGDTDSIAASSTPAKHLTGPELHGLALVGATGPLAAPDRGRSRSEPGSREMWP